MEEKIVLALMGGFGTAVIGGVSFLVAMKVEIAVMKEKIEYQAMQLREIFTKFPAIKRD